MRKKTWILTIEDAKKGLKKSFSQGPNHDNSNNSLEPESRERGAQVMGGSRGGALRGGTQWPVIMMDAASYFKSMVKTSAITIDNFVFWLHYRITVGLLLAASNISVAKQYFGDLINFQMSSGIESKVLDNYCWIHSTFHIRTEFQGYVGCLVDMELMEDKKSLCWSEYQHFSTFHPFLSVLAALRPQNWNTICAVILTLYWSEYHYFCTFSSLPI